MGTKSKVKEKNFIYIYKTENITAVERPGQAIRVSPWSNSLSSPTRSRLKEERER